VTGRKWRGVWDVYDIKPRYTKIKTLNNTIITIPNSKVINEQIVNYAVPDDTIRVKIPGTVWLMERIL